MDTKHIQYHTGIDVGSTTVKVVTLDASCKEVFSKYRRHYADVRQTVLVLLDELKTAIGDVASTFSITGSGGLNLSKQVDMAFVQEVIAVSSAIRSIAPQTDVVIELGGEDAKIIYLTNGVEQRMNGICAGGTGAFIDQMAALIQTDASGLNEYAKSYRELYPIAARCGVFAKSDIQPLINDGVSREDLAASIFQAVVNQTISGLACGRRIKGNVAFLGGPLYFLSELRAAFIRTLGLDASHVVFPSQAHLFAARGAALASRKTEAYALSDIMTRLQEADRTVTEMHQMDPLFESEEAYQAFTERQKRYVVSREPLETYQGDCFLGIDAGSTTTKLCLVSEKGTLLYTFYSSNYGDPIEIARQAMAELDAKMPKTAHIRRACSTGYGETLMKSAFHLDEGEVETIAHYAAARFFDPDVDCILDIGGQDMKCIRLKDGSVDSIMLNEACSAGCGSFIENFANSLGYTAEQFANKALYAKHPIDLGTRCTIFMNSNVKQAQKEGATVEDIAAGLAMSVIKNALFKVIKLTDAKMLGEHIVAQGGTFYNDAVLRSFETLLGHEVIRPDIAGLMGAFGAALIAREHYAGQASTMLNLQDAQKISCRRKTTHCRGCQNQCRLTINIFSDGTRHISGNRCEKGLQTTHSQNPAPNLFEYKKERLFRYEPLSEAAATRGTIGIPRVLNMYENFPFWARFFAELKFRVVLSPFSTHKIFQAGMDSIPSESACYPAKLTHGHIEWLIAQNVKTIFYPCVYFERRERSTAQNHYNCPMVISYPENIKNNMEHLEEAGVRFLHPFLAFTDEDTLSLRLIEFMGETFGIPAIETSLAAHRAWREFMQCRKDILAEGVKALQWIEEHHAHGIVLAGRPYHLDPEINHGIPEMIHSQGFAVLTEDSISELQKTDITLRATNQWMYHSRLYAAAQYVCSRADLDLVQLNSFGCGLDAVTIDQVQDILAQAHKLHTVLKIDEISNLGSARIRIRSLKAALDMRQAKQSVFKTEPLHGYARTEYTKAMNDAGYTILTTNMSPIHFRFLHVAFHQAGYRFELLSNESPEVMALGLKYVNNDACYPAMLTTGQMMEAIQSGRYDTSKLALMMSQTGGGCRASNYVGFIRRALQSAGYSHIPVISFNTNGMETNSGFKLTPMLGIKMIFGLYYGDLLMRCLYRTRPYEVIPGSANALYEKWATIAEKQLASSSIDRSSFYDVCRQIIRAFDALEINENLVKPKVGIVGEILVKFMPLANNHLVELLEAEGAEVTVPPFIGFLEYCTSDALFKARYLGQSLTSLYSSRLILSIFDGIRKHVYAEIKNSSRFTIPENIYELGRYAENIIQLGNQSGEGWFLTGEMVDLVKNGVENIVCIQPFGCLPNHIVGKGTIKKIKSLYPQANIVAVDYDPSASKVNQLNRIKLMLEVAREQIESKDHAG